MDRSRRLNVRPEFQEFYPVACGHMRRSPVFGHVYVQVAFNFLEESYLVLIKSVRRQLDFDKEEAFFAVNHKQVRWLRMCLADEVCRFLSENPYSLEVAETVPIFTPVIAGNVMTLVNVVNRSGQFPEAVSLGLQYWTPNWNLFCRRFAFEVFEKDCRATVLPL